MSRHLSIAEALREAITEEMERDGSVFCMGEDIGIPGGWGGAFTVTLGLEKRFRNRMIDTPISENGFVGAGVGAAMMGLRPIVDLQYADFVFCAMDQVVGNAAKLRYMSGGKLSVPMVLRAPVGITGRGAQHAGNPESYFMGTAGLKIVTVATAYDAKGLLKSAVRDNNPVLFFEHKLLYGSKGARAESGAVDGSSDIPDDEYTIPIGEAAVRREGGDVTILGWLLMAHFAAQAGDLLAADGIEAEVIDLRSLVPMDFDAIAASVKKTGRLVIAEEGPTRGGIGAEIAARCAEELADYLDAPVRRVASPNIPPPFSPPMEAFYRPDAERIANAARESVEG